MPAAATLLQVLLICLMSIEAAHAWVLVDQGEPVATIVVPDEPARTVSCAADDLQQYVERMSGAQLPIVTAATPAASPRIFLGAQPGAPDPGVDVTSGVRFHHALFTGAARRFGTRWGVAIYGQMDFEAADICFPLAYEQGATYFWFWTSDKAHHVPFAEQLQRARALREYIAENPRTESRQELVSAARVALALPWGYMFDHYSMKVYKDYFQGGEHDSGRMWFSEHMELGDQNRQGVTYRTVLATAARQAAALLEAGTRFDVVFLHPDEKIAGYETVHRVLETGELATETFE